jgi:hypothetical protein
VHHIGFVVNHLYAHLKVTCPEYTSDFTLLERAEQLSLYDTVDRGGVRFMIQLSQIKIQYEGLQHSAN